MKAELEIESEKPLMLMQALSPSLGTDERVKHDVEAARDSLRVETETDSIGTLRSSTDSSIKLAMLAKRILR